MAEQFHSNPEYSQFQNKEGQNEHISLTEAEILQTLNDSLISDEEKLAFLDESFNTPLYDQIVWETGIDPLEV